MPGPLNAVGPLHLAADTLFYVSKYRSHHGYLGLSARERTTIAVPEKDSMR